MRVRFAPSPTGRLHIGSARTALFNWLFARHHGGTFVLRVEDTDAARSQRRHEETILEDLAWLGLDWDEGPESGGPYGPYRQSERLEAYRTAATRLVAAGHAYHCFCSEERLEEVRARQRAEGVPPRYDRRCAALAPDEVRGRLAAGETAAVRLRVPERETVVDDLLRGPVVFGAGAFGDFIILRSDGVAAYNFAAVVDDRDMAITHVIRGDDHLTNTARQLAVFTALGAPPPVYAHHGMIHDPEGGKLSKRYGATAVGQYREMGYLPQALVNYLALLSWSHDGDEMLDRERLVREFEVMQLSPSAAVFDLAKLNWLQHEYVMTLDPAEHRRLFAERLPAAIAPPAAAALAAAFQPSLAAYQDAPALAAAVLEAPRLTANARRLLADARPQVAEFRRLRVEGPEWLDADVARETLAGYRSWGKARGIAARDLLMPLRVALTGREHGPELHFVLAALARRDAVHRLDDALVAAARAEENGATPPAAAAGGSSSVSTSSPTEGDHT